MFEILVEMKLKLKLHKTSEAFKVELDKESQTFQHLRDSVSLILNSTFDYQGSIPFNISLNGRDVITDNGLTKLSDRGIVSGDLLYILIESDIIKTLIPRGNVTSQDNMEEIRLPDETKTSEENEHLINRYLNKPMLIYESMVSSIPSSLREEFERSEVETVYDALTVVLVVLMKESGFVLQSKSKTAGEISNFIYYHKNSPTSHCKLVAIPLERILMVNGIVCGEGNEESKVLVKWANECDYYIIKKPSYRGIDPIHIYRNLAQLSNSFKDSFVYPLQMFAQSAVGIPTGLLALPTEVKHLILRFLDARSLLSVSATCSELKQVASDQTLWKKLFYLKFKSTAETAEINWKQEHREAYLRAKELRRYQSHLGRRPPFAAHHANPLPFPPMAPFQIVGGDYDLYPLAYPGGSRGIFAPNTDTHLPSLYLTPSDLLRLLHDRRNPHPDRNRDPFAFSDLI